MASSWRKSLDLPWNSLDFINAAIESGVEEIELTRDWHSMNVNSDSVVENYHASINRDGHMSIKTIAFQMIMRAMLLIPLTLRQC